MWPHRHGLERNQNEDSTRWKGLLTLLVNRINMYMTILDKTTCRFNVILVKIEKTIINFTWKHKLFQIAKETLRTKNNTFLSAPCLV